MFERRLYHHVDWAMVGAILALCLIGLAQIYSTTTTPARTPAPQPAAVPVAAPADGDLWSFIWLAMSVGALSLLTPCVFPMVPITVSYFTNHAAGSRKSAVGNAVVRNRVRRRLKAISSTVDRVGSGQSTVDIVFRAHPAAASATFSELHDDVISLVSRVSAPGTGPGRKA